MAENRHLEIRPDSGYYRYIRRVPLEVAHVDRRGVIKKGLKTKDPAIAAARAKAIDDSVEALWAAILTGSGSDAWAAHDADVRLARTMGFAHMPAKEILADPDVVVERLLAIIGHEDTRAVPQALLGTGKRPDLHISGLFDKYIELRQPDLLGYSKSQLRKHRQPKQRAAAYLLQVVGDKVLSAVTRADALSFLQWWSEKIDSENLTAAAANRSLTDVKGMLSTIDAKLQTDYRAVWAGLRIKPKGKTKSQPRATYSVEFLQNSVLVPGRLERVNRQARMIFYGLIETGARPSELCNLRPEQIHAFAPIPYIEILETDERILKSDNAIRVVPLVGVSLWALRQCPEGFPDYRDNEDSFSATMNKALLALGLRPTKRHTVYSVRHTFQDRILAAGASDRLQTDLMGHEFERAKYGEGASLEQKVELLNRIRLSWPLA